MFFVPHYLLLDLLLARIGSTEIRPFNRVGH